MDNQVIVADEKTLRRTVAGTVRDILLSEVPKAIRAAHQPEWLSRDQAKERYGLTDRQLTYLRGKRKVEYSQHGRRIFYRRASLDAYFDEGRVEARTDQSSSAS